MQQGAYLANSNVVRALRRGGNESNGANDGVSAVNANNAPSNSNSNYGAGQSLVHEPALYTSTGRPLERRPIDSADNWHRQVLGPCGDQNRPRGNGLVAIANGRQGIQEY